MKMIVRYEQSFGRMGCLEDTFIATAAELKALEAWGECHRGEVLGKHSDITATLDDDTLTVLTEDQDFIAKAVEYGLVAERNPFACRIEEEIADDPEALGKLSGLTAMELREVAEAWGFIDALT